MIAVHTSALMAIALGEMAADACMRVLENRDPAHDFCRHRGERGAHPAGLNFGDCFSYEVAKEHSCPLLYVRDDFSKTIWKAPFEAVSRSSGDLGHLPGRCLRGDNTNRS